MAVCGWREWFIIEEKTEKPGMSMEQEKIQFQVRENRAEPVCGMLAIGVAVFIFIMWLRHPSGRGGGLILFVPLIFMIAVGLLAFVDYFHRKLLVDEMNICYVNIFGKEKRFSLDEIGFCKVGAGGGQDVLVLYDLLGGKLCKLGTDMRGFAQFHQYLLDNRVRVEWSGKRMSRQAMHWVDAVQGESAVCEEEIRKCTEKFYEKIAPVFREWEKRNRKFHVSWEIGFAQYAGDDLTKRCRLRERTSSLHEPLETIPLSYECIFEAYLKSEDAYIVDSRGREIYIILPYLARTKSYQIGEGTRIRKMDEGSLQKWLTEELMGLERELPKHRYRTEKFHLCHKLSLCAGIKGEVSGLRQ